MAPTTSLNKQNRWCDWGKTSGNLVLTLNGTNNFINNLANSGSGGAINVQTNTLLTFSHNSAVYYGGAIYPQHVLTLTTSSTTQLLLMEVG